VTRTVPIAVVLALVLGACVPKHADLPERQTDSLEKGDRAYARGDLPKAEKEYARAIATGGPEAGDARYLRARVRVERGDLAGAEADASDVITAMPRHWEALCLLGMVREKQGRRTDAAGYFQRALEIAPREIAPRTNLAFLALQDGRDREAYDLLVSLVQDFPDSARAWRHLATAATRLGLEAEATTATNAARRLAEGDEREPP